MTCLHPTGRAGEGSYTGRNRIHNSSGTSAINQYILNNFQDLVRPRLYNKRIYNSNVCYLQAKKNQTSGFYVPVAWFLISEPNYVIDYEPLRGLEPPTY